MEKTTHYEETTKVVETGSHAHGTHTTDKKHKSKKNKHAKDTQYGPKKTVGTKIREFFTGRHDNGIIYQNGLPIAGLNGPIVQPMGAPIRQPAEIHPVATVNNTPAPVGHIHGQHFEGPTTTTYGPAPPLGPGMPEGYSRTTTHTEYIQPGAQYVQPMNAVAQPTGLGAIAQPAGVIIANKAKQTGLVDGYLQDRKVQAFPGQTVQKAKANKDKHAKHGKHETAHHHEEVYHAPAQAFPVSAVPAEPAPVIFTGPARVMEEKHVRTEKHHDKHHDQHLDSHMYQDTHLTSTDHLSQRSNVSYQAPIMEQQAFAPTQHYDQHIHTSNLPPTTTVNQPGYILQQPGIAPSNQPLVRNHEQVPMTSHSGLAQGGIFQNDTARPVQTFTPILQGNQPLTEAPILNQAAQEQAMFAPTGIRTKEGLVETRALGGQHASGAKYTNPAGYEERKETVVHKDIQY